MGIGMVISLVALLSNPPPLDWHADLASAEAAAEASGKAMLVVFR